MSGFMDAASNLAERCVWAALGFHRTGNAVGLPGPEDDGVGFGEGRTLILEGSPFTAQCIAGRAAAFLSLLIPMEIVARKTVSLALGFVRNRHMWLDLFFLYHPGQHRRGFVSGVANEAFRLDVELRLDPVYHDLGTLDLGRAISHTVFGIDQIIRGVSVERWATWSSGLAGLRISQR